MEYSSSSSSSSRTGKRRWRLLRAVFYMLRKGIVSKDKLMMDLHLLLQRGKLAGKALGNFMNFHHAHGPTFSCRSLDPDLSFHHHHHHPREFQFGCSDALEYAAVKRQKHRRRREHEEDDELIDYDAAAVAEAFEVFDDADSSVVLVASPMTWSYGGMSPAAVPRQLRVTDSPFPTREEEEGDEDDGSVDEQAEEFIRRFYEQLRLQQRIPTTPACRRYRRHEAVAGKA